MRTLLVDNYDSFTYNLFHYLAEVNGREPEVIRNDDPAWREGLLDAFDNVVLSPGPGTPHRPADFGLCARIAEEGRLPVLGVCLGHQGMALAHGAEVGPAPEPRHGRTSWSGTTAPGCSRTSPTPWKWSGTTLWPSPRSLRRWRRSPTAPTTEWSWRCATAPCRCGAYSSTPSRSARAAGTACWPTSAI